MDLLSTTSSFLTLVSAFADKDRKLMPVMHRCVIQAISNTVIDTLGLPDPIATVLSNIFTAERSVDLFIEPIQSFNDSDCYTIWRENFLRQAVNAHQFTNEVNLADIADHFAKQLGNQLQEHQTNPQSPIFQIITSKKIDQLIKHSTSMEKTNTNNSRHLPKAVSNQRQLTNLHEFPSPLYKVNRAELQATVALLEQKPQIVITGEPGAGKSTMAHAIASTRRENLIWWFQGSTRETFLGSCLVLLERLSITPGSAPEEQVRDILNKEPSWLVIIDDFHPFDVIHHAIPDRRTTGSVIYTTRNAREFPKNITVELEMLDSSAASDLCDHYSGDIATPEQKTELYELCDGNPLAIATLATYQRASGHSWGRVFTILESHPAHALSSSPHKNQTSSFFEIVQTSLSAASEQIEETSTIMLALALCRGLAPRILLELGISNTVTFLDMEAAISKAGEYGLIRFNKDSLSCHALISELVLNEATEQKKKVASETLLSTIETLCEEPSEIPLHPHILTHAVDCLAETLSPTNIQSLRARTSIASSLAERGWVSSAIRYVEKVLSDARLSHPTTSLSDILVQCSQVYLQCGATQKLQELISDIRERDLYLDTENRVQLLLCEAWNSEVGGDPILAKSAIDEALALLPDASEMRAIHSYFTRGDTPLTTRVHDYRKVASNEDADPLNRATYASLASRDLRQTGQISESVDLARLALNLDESHAGPYSQLVARDCCDLGAALVDAGSIEESIAVLERSRSIYQSEDFNNPQVSPTLIHLARAHLQLAVRFESSGEFPSANSCRVAASSYLDNSERLARASSDRVLELSSVLHTRAELLMSQSLFLSDQVPEIFSLLSESILIDSQYFGSESAEVGISRTTALQAACLLDRPKEATEHFKEILANLSSWERDIPLAMFHALSSWNIMVETGVIDKSSMISGRSLSAKLSRLQRTPEVSEFLRSAPA